jgi:aryl-alcohol dehydrogenase-like predicted oxidoreductase
VERRHLGRSALTVPIIGMGTWRTFDTDGDRRPVVEAAIESGIDLFDTSPMYGRAEAALARALEGIRERVQIATKIWTSSADEGRSQADYALRLFDWIDVYQVHNLVNVPAQLSLLERLEAEGKVRGVGATHYQESAFPDLAALMRTKRLDMVQIPYTPLRRTAERELLPLAESLGLGVFVMSPLQEGILDRRPPAAQLKELGVETWAQAVLKWIASDPRVSAVLSATKDVGHVRENAAAGNPPFFSPEQRALVVRIAERKYF